MWGVVLRFWISNFVFSLKMYFKQVTNSIARTMQESLECNLKHDLGSYVNHPSKVFWQSVSQGHWLQLPHVWKMFGSKMPSKILLALRSLEFESSMGLTWFNHIQGPPHAQILYVLDIICLVDLPTLGSRNGVISIYGSGWVHVLDMSRECQRWSFWQLFSKGMLHHHHIILCKKMCLYLLHVSCFLRCTCSNAPHFGLSFAQILFNIFFGGSHSRLLYTALLGLSKQLGIKVMSDLNDAPLGNSVQDIFFPTDWMSWTIMCCNVFLLLEQIQNSSMAIATFGGNFSVNSSLVT